MNEESRVALDPATFNHAVNPMRPSDVVAPGPVQAAPPVCPSGLCTRDTSRILYFLYVVTANPKGDVLLACLNCGYEAVYRVETGAFEPRPGREGEPWRAPYRTTREAAAQIMRNMSDGKPTGFSTPGAEPKKVAKKTGGAKAAGNPARKDAAAAESSAKAASSIEVVNDPAQPQALPSAQPVPGAGAEVKPLTVRQAAEFACVHVNKITAAIKKGTLRSYGDDALKIVMSTDVAAWLKGA